MLRHGLVLGMVAALGAAPAGAAVVGRSLAKGLGSADLAAIQPVVEAALSEDAAGSVRPWQGSNGKAGKVHLLSGGAKAGDKCGRVRVTSLKAGKESSGYRFTYCRDAAGRWRTTG